MKYEELTAYIKNEMRKQKIAKTYMAMDLGMDIRTLNKYLYNDRHIPVIKLLELLDYLYKDIVIVEKG